MAAVVTGSVLPGVVINVANTLESGVSQPLNVNLPNGQSPIQFAAGTGAQQLTKTAIASARALASGTPETDDLTALGADYIGGTTDFTSTGVKIFAVRNNEAAGSGKNLTFSGGASNPWVGKLGGTTPTYTIGPGETLLMESLVAGGMAVSGTASDFKLDPGANAINCTVIVAG